MILGGCEPPAPLADIPGLCSLAGPTPALCDLEENQALTFKIELD